MADSARWIAAVESEGLWENGSFLDAYQNNRQGMVDLTLESDPVAVGILNLMDDRPGWTGTSTALLEELRQVTPEDLRKLKEFPKASNVLSNRLMRLEGFLATRGLRIARERTPQQRLVTLSWAEFEKEAAAAAIDPPELSPGQDFNGDYGTDRENTAVAGTPCNIQAAEDTVLEAGAA
jgi:hypothetical protein